ncbi:MAG: ABC transporter permease [Bacteroidales bacterium]|nr:ABC transporter permease [Bacteroidales bacterium]
MKLPLPLRFAFRYLFARKSHNVINVISGISVAGMAVGTAALVIILSVFNGFDDLVRKSLDEIDPDIRITPSTGKVFTPDSVAFAKIYDDPRIASISSVIEEQVFLSYMDNQGICIMRGVDQVYEEETPLRDRMLEGEFKLHYNRRTQGVFGAALAYNMGISYRLITPVDIYYPSRTAPFSIQNPSASLRQQKVFPAGTMSINADADSKLAIVPIEVMRELLEYDTEVSALEIRLADGEDTKAVVKDIETVFGPGFDVKDRIRQNDALYKMMRYEKLAIYLILIFVVIIIAFSVLSSLTMLIIEKEQDMETLRSLGAPEGLTSRIFRLEGWMITLLGMVIGLVVGTVAVLIQQRFGIIQMPGNFAVSAYPVILKATDFLFIILGVALAGYAVACIPSVKQQGR